MNETHSVCVYMCTDHSTSTHPVLFLLPPVPEVFLSDTSHLCIMALMVRSSMCSVFLGSQWLFGILPLVVESMGFCWGLTVFSLYK